MNDELKQAIAELKETMAEMQRRMLTMMKNVWSVQDLSIIIGVSEGRIRHLANSNVLPYYKQNGSLYFKRSEIEAWQTRNRTASKDEVNSKAATYYATRRIK